MGDIFRAIILGLVEGATEFLPVSSTGHLIIVQDWLGVGGDPRWNTFNIFIQLGAMLAVIWLYREKVLRVLSTLTSDPVSRRFAMNVIIAFIPAAIVGLLLDDWIEANLFNPYTVAIALVVGGIAILLIERWASKRVAAITDVDQMPHRVALGVGLAQVLSLFPGVSRAGATIIGAYSLGMSRKAATEFSFFLAVVTLGAASLYSLAKGVDRLSTADIAPFAVGFVVAFLSAFVVIKAFIAFVSRSSFAPFAWYRIVFGLLLLAYYGLWAG